MESRNGFFHCSFELCSKPWSVVQQKPTPPPPNNKQRGQSYVKGGWELEAFFFLKRSVLCRGTFVILWIYPPPRIPVANEGLGWNSLLNM